ncbi:hypothetical protein JCM12294_16420 [Desulfocicer niacini]
MKYFTAAELVKQMGTTRDKWGITLVKELIDNALDGAESAGVNPDITVTIDEDSLSVMDNGPGIPAHVIEKSIDYGVKVSNKFCYVSPSRGQQGNALMCVYACPFVVNGDYADVEIHSNGTRYDIHVSLNRIAQSPEITTTISESEFIEKGTFIKIHGFNLACSTEYIKPRISTKLNCLDLMKRFSCCNPHANLTLSFDGETRIYPRAGKQTKWTSDMSLVCRWYNPDKFISLVSSSINENPKMKVNDFLKQFEGLKAPPKQKLICDSIGINSRDGIVQFKRDNDIDSAMVTRLLCSMKENTREIQPVKLGYLNADHVKTLWAQHEHQLFEHRNSKGTTATGMPYTLDVFFQVAEGLSYRAPEICLNHSVLIDGGINGMESFLNSIHIEFLNDVALFIHIACPSFDFLGNGKNKINLHDDIFNDLKSRIAIISKEWTKAQKKKRRDQKATLNKRKKIVNKKRFMSQRDAAFKVMKDAYMKASSGNTLPAQCRQVLYAARREVLMLAGIDKLGDGYFRTLVREFQAENPELTKDWDIVFDARGNMIEPFTEKRVPLGTIAVRNYISSFDDIHISAGGEVTGPNISMPVVSINGHKGRYKYALYIEKEGFESLIHAAKIQERYGIAYLSTKGMSSEAARVLIERLSDEGVTTFALHDFDHAGFNIARILSEDTDMYKFKSDVDVIDIGLRLEDIKGLEREVVTYQEQDPRDSIIKAGATDEEADILVQGKDPDKWDKEKQKIVPGKWHGERVELNAMTSGQFVELIESKLEAHGVKKVIPDDNILRDTYRKTQAARLKKKALDKIMEKYMPEIRKELSQYEAPAIDVPGNLREMIREKITGNTKPWEKALMEL